ncbi:hypothetical protein D3C71_1199620 [compost metagenome]
MITGRRFTGEDFHPRHPVDFRLGANRLVQRHGVHQVEQLAFVLVDALDLHVEHRRRIDRNPQPLVNQVGQGFFTVQPLFGKSFAERGLLGERLKAEQPFFGIVQQFRTEGIDQHRGQLGVGLIQPPAEGDAVGLVVDPFRVELVQLGEHRFAHQLRVQPGYAVDAVGTKKRQVAHAHAAAVVFFDQRNRAQHVEVVDAFGAQRVDVLGVDQVDDLHVSRQHAFHQTDRPGFQRFGQQCVVGVGKRVDRDLPRRVPGHVIHVDQLTHQLGHRDRGMGVVELDRSVIAQGQHRGVHVAMTAQQVL